MGARAQLCTGAASAPAALCIGTASTPPPCLTLAAVVLEGTATSLMSKVIWSELAMGVLNAGVQPGFVERVCLAV